MVGIKKKNASGIFGKFVEESLESSWINHWGIPGHIPGTFLKEFLKYFSEVPGEFLEEFLGSSRRNFWIIHELSTLVWRN